MQAKWLIQNHYDLEGKDLIPELEKQGIEYKMVDYEPLQSGTYNHLFNANDCVIVHSTLNMAQQLRREVAWIPGVYCNFDNMKCTTYYSHWGNFLLNNDYVMIPFMEFVRRSDEFYKMFGVDGCIFIRPNNGTKSFTGHVLPKDELESETKIINQYSNIDLDKLLIIISSPKVIDVEWRVVIADKQVVTLSQYKKDGKLNTNNDTSNYDVLKLARGMAKHDWQPDRVYTIDIALSNGVYSLLEINSFSCSGLYNCDYSAVVKYVSLVAENEWMEYN